MNKKVSVIMPAYNVEKYIEAALSSLLVQTYQNLEIIVVDDGSVDGTASVIERLAAADERIRSLRQENAGVSSARNNALKLATGEYICFLDSDDTAEEAMIEKLVSAIENSGADLVECQYSRWDQDGNREDDFNFTDFDITLSSDDEKIRFITEELLLYHMGFEVWNKIYRTGIIREYGIGFDEDCRMGEDLSFNIKYLLNCGRILGISDRLVRYLIREGSAIDEAGSLSGRIDDDLIVISDVWDYVNGSEKAEIARRFPDLFVRMMDHAFSLKSSKEAVQAFKEVREVNFAKTMYRKLDCSRENFERLYGNDMPVNRSKLHLHVKCSIGAASVKEHLLMLLYRLNRKRQHKSMPEDWKLPY